MFDAADSEVTQPVHTQTQHSFLLSWLSLQGEIAFGESPRQALPMTYNISVLPQPQLQIHSGRASYIIICGCEFWIHVELFTVEYFLAFSPRRLITFAAFDRHESLICML